MFTDDVTATSGVVIQSNSESLRSVYCAVVWKICFRCKHESGWQDCIVFQDICIVLVIAKELRQFT
jgi:hypothetical protein